MSDTAIKVENLSKRCRIGLKEEMHDTLAGALTRPIRNLRQLRKLTEKTERRLRRWRNAALGRYTQIKQKIFDQRKSARISVISVQ